MKKNPGFGIVGIVLVVATVVLAGVIAWRVYDSTQHKTDTTQQSTNNQTQGTTQASADNKTYKSEKYGFTFEYPKDWSVETVATITVLKAPGTVTIDQPIGLTITDKGAMVTLSPPSNCAQARSCYATDLYSGKLMSGGATNKSSLTLSDGTKADRFTFVGALYTAFVRSDKDIVISIDTADDELTSPYLKDYDNILNSIKILTP